MITAYKRSGKYKQNYVITIVFKTRKQCVLQPQLNNRAMFITITKVVAVLVVIICLISKPSKYEFPLF